MTDLIQIIYTPGDHDPFTIVTGFGGQVLTRTTGDKAEIVRTLMEWLEVRE